MPLQKLKVQFGKIKDNCWGQLGNLRSVENSFWDLPDSPDLKNMEKEFEELLSLL